jgi:hypothetical protein
MRSVSKASRFGRGRAETVFSIESVIMKSLITGILACCAALAAAGTAADETTTGILTGRVEGVYVRLEPGVYRETMQPRRYTEIWAEVKTYQLGEDRSKGAMLMIRTDPSVERGDIVSFRLSDDSLIPISPLPRETRIVAVAAKRGTAVALTYGSTTHAAGF